MVPLAAIALVAGLTAQPVVADVIRQINWEPGQVNTRICEWGGLRATVLRDAVYLDGGDLYWEPGFADGSVKPPKIDYNAGIIWTLNFSKPFNTSENITAILEELRKTPTGGGNLQPDYYDGALLGNNEEFFLFGGMTRRTGAFADPPGDRVLTYRRFQYSGFKDNFAPFIDTMLRPNTTRYITYGGAASAPSENLAWYFSGLRAPGGGPIHTPSGASDETHAVEVSNSLIVVDLSDQQQETFTNYTLPPDIPGRANPELVWVPVGQRGILVALGGVIYPDFVDVVDGKSANETASKEISPTFMTTIDIYDVASGKWYRQGTSGGGPGQLTRGCAVVARAQDASSFNIYWYGGYDGLNRKQPLNDDVWVLSLPSFTWTKLVSSKREGRAGHKCVMPYPDQMFVIGGYLGRFGNRVECLPETIRVFNLSSGEWMTRYDPAVWSNYTVPTAVREKIGGTGTGGATLTTPSPSGWADKELAKIFDTPYPTSKITTYYPYESLAPTDNTNPTIPVPTDSTSHDRDGGVPSYLPPVLGSVLGLVFLTMVAVLILLWRRRKLLRGAVSEAGTEEASRRRIRQWLRGQPTVVKTPTVTSSDYLPQSVLDAESNVSSLPTLPPQMTIAEMMDTEIKPLVELPADPPARAELQGPATKTPSSNIYGYYGPCRTDFALTPPSGLSTASPTISTPSPAPGTGTTPSSGATGPCPAPTSTGTSSQTSPESPVVYHSNTAIVPPGVTATSSPTSPAAEKDDISRLRNSPQDQPPYDRIVSQISNLSERDRAHLRQLSDTTVSSVTTAVGSPDPNTNTGTGRVPGGVSGLTEGDVIPTPGQGPSSGLGGRESPMLRLRVVPSVGGGVPGSPARRSMFTERAEDMVDERK